jgi:dCMP deaminase
MNGDIRINRHRMFLDIAEIISGRGTCKRAKVGAVVVREGRILSMGYVGSPPGLPHCIDSDCELGPDGGCIRTQHAEANAIAWAAREGISIKGGLLYSTMSPCLSCAKLIVMAGIVAVIYEKEYRDTAGIDYLKKCGVPTWPGKVATAMVSV